MKFGQSRDFPLSQKLFVSLDGGRFAACNEPVIMSTAACDNSLRKEFDVALENLDSVEELDKYLAEPHLVRTSDP